MSNIRILLTKVISIIVARNEEDTLANTILSLKAQNQKNKIIIVDDGSTDKTPQIAKKFGCITISLPYHSDNYVGTPLLAKRWNIGLKMAKRLRPEYILILGADHLLPSYYIKYLIENMEDRTVIASGIIKNDTNSLEFPHGSGRLIKANFWIKANNMKFPVVPGWEAYIVYKALMMGFKVEVFRELESISRPISISPKKAFGHGRGMRSLGYNWLYALGRIVKYFSKSPYLGIYMFWGFIHKKYHKIETSKYVKKYQKNKIKRNLKKIFKVI